MRLTVFMFAVAVLLVELGEALACGARSWRERAHDADARQRLLQVGGDRGDLLAREPVGVGGDDPERERRRPPSTGKTRNVSSASCDVEHEQDHRRADQRQRGAEQRHDAVGDELVERLHVVGQPRDEHAGLAARVEADRQRLQVREELDAAGPAARAGRPSRRGRSARRSRPSRRAPLTRNATHDQVERRRCRRA